MQEDNHLSPREKNYLKNWDHSLKALDGPLAREVLKQGPTTLAKVITSAKCLEKLEREYPTPGFESFTNIILQEGFAKLREEMKEQKKDVAVKMAQEQPLLPLAIASATLSLPQSGDYVQEAPPCYMGGNMGPLRYLPPPYPPYRFYLGQE